MGVAMVIGVATLALLAVGLLLLRSSIRRWRGRASARLGPGPFVRRSDARSLGVRSAGVWQVRGSGSLALSGTELVFAQWVPDRSLRIPRTAIESVDTIGSHLGKTVGARLLRVRWRADGREDEIALQVPDLDGWLRDLGAIPGSPT